MFFVDKIKIIIKSGNGGDGCISFAKEKYVAKGGPDGGDGGKGGDVYFLADESIDNLSEFSLNKKFVAKDGERGGSDFCHGKSGEDLYIKVPKGTILTNLENNEVILDTAYTQKSLIMQGGQGGKGNARFKNSIRQAPRFCQAGQKTKEHQILLELKTIADIGLLGCPNAGKSTFLSVVSNAKPKIADYPFTTLTPNIGVIKDYSRAYYVADIPGLIEGAGHGVGLGLEFLRHVERTKLLFHLIDISEENPINNFLIVNKELKQYGRWLSRKPQLIVFNKCELVDTSILQEYENQILALKKNAKVFFVSCATGSGIKELVSFAVEKLKKMKKRNKKVVPHMIEDMQMDFIVERDQDGVLTVRGGLIEELARNVILDNYESSRWFMQKLKENGIENELKKLGVKNGETVRILDTEFDYSE